MVADSSGSWTRYLGLELALPSELGPRSLRYAAIVDDGVLIKLVRCCCCCCWRAKGTSPAVEALSWVARGQSIRGRT